MVRKGERIVIRTLVAEHVQLLRLGLVSFLTREPDIDVISEMAESAHLLSVASELAPSVAVVDADLPSVGGPEVVTRLQATVPECAAVMLVDQGDTVSLCQAMAVEPLGLLSKETPADLLTRCIRDVVTGRRVVDPDLARTAHSIAENPLTRREREVLRLAAAGASTDEIAEHLSVTAKTVRNHLSRVFLRLGARNRVDAIRIASANKWL
jgi:two-component system response regulator DesR